MSRTTTVTIETAGVTDFAVGQTSDGRRVVVAQPDVGDRLAPGDRVIVEERFSRARRITEWAWEDPKRRRVVELARRKAARAEAARVEAYQAALEEALSRAELPSSGASWEERLDSLLAVIPERDRTLPFGACHRQEDRLRQALEAWLRWAESEPIDQVAFDRKLVARLRDGVLYQRGLVGFVPLPDEAEKTLAALREAPVPIPPRLLECAQRVAEDRSFRFAWQWMQLSLQARWSQHYDADMALPNNRYFVIARGTDSFDLFALDAAKPEDGTIWCVNRVDGVDEPRMRAPSFDDLLVTALEHAEDAVSIDPDPIDREAIARLTQWVRG